MSFLPDTPTSSDCTPQPKLEGTLHRATRAVYNLVHPHHRHTYTAPVALVCKAPELETVTITAAQDDGPQIHYPGEAHHASYGSSAPFVPAYYTGGLGDRVDQPIPLPHASVPEPSALLILLPSALFAAFVAKRRAT